MVRTPLEEDLTHQDGLSFVKESLEVRATCTDAFTPLEERTHNQTHRPTVREREVSDAPLTAVSTPLEPPGTTLPDVPPGVT